jgi:peptidoglycan/xylan/chitin deacetylase (PgdA/CDA1 family)
MTVMMMIERLQNLLPGKLLSIIHDYKQVFFLLVPLIHIRQDPLRDHSPDGYVIFRMDDVSDYWVKAAQVALMDLFITRNQNLSLGLVMNSIGNDTKLVEKVKEGSSKELFELCLHGWNHLDYTKLSEKQQELSLLKANEKMMALFGHSSSVFIAPYGLFDMNGIEAMKNTGLKILSANGSAEYSFDKNKSTYVAKRRIGVTKKNQATKNNTIYHLPTTVPFKLYLKGRRFDISVNNVLKCIMANVARYGYAVVVFHPQDFVEMDRDGNFTNNLQEKDIKTVSQLIDSLLSTNVRMTSFSRLIQFDSIDWK